MAPVSPTHTHTHAHPRARPVVRKFIDAVQSISSHQFSRHAQVETHDNARKLKWFVISIQKMSSLFYISLAIPIG